MGGRSSILITGASGFVGSHLVEAALAEGMEVWAGVRQTSSRQWLQDERINFITLSLNDPDSLRRELGDFISKHGGEGWDYVVHAAGATKARSEADFMRSNCDATRNLAEALLDLDIAPQRFVLMSSLSAEAMANGMPTIGDAPTAYGRSKMAAEECLRALSHRLNYIVLRPTGVYGPRERDYYLMAKSVKRHIDFGAGLKPQLLTFIYIRDLCRATLRALDHGQRGDIIMLSDGHAYQSRDFSRLLQKEMDVRRVVHITAPLWVLRCVCVASEWISKLTGRMTALNRDKYNILKQRDWRCDLSSMREGLDFAPQTTLAQGVAETVAWYKQQKWI